MAERDDDGFLDRWSRRKRGETSTGAPETETADAGPAAVAQPETQESADTGDPEVVAKLPDLDSLTEESDFTAFLQDGVPEVIRRKALRRLWRLNPIFANLDGLNDYDEDFSALGIVAENIKTIYKVGKGYLDEDEDEDEDKDKNKDEAEIAADESGEAETGGAEGEGEPESEPKPEPEPEPEPEPSNPSDSIESTKVSLSAPESGSGQAASSNREPESVKPARGSALARRWGGSPDKG
jgi:hypothetical protein